MESSMSLLNLFLDKLWAVFLAVIYILDNDANNGTSGPGGEETGKEQARNSEKEHSQDPVFALACSPSFWQGYHHANEYVCKKKIFPTLVSIQPGTILKIY